MADIVKHSSSQLPAEYDCLKDYIIELTSDKVVYKVPANVLRISIKTMKLYFRSVEMDLIFDRMTGKFNSEFEIYHCYFYRQPQQQKRPSTISLVNNSSTNKLIDLE
jgi:hypothetical protein